MGRLSFVFRLLIGAMFLLAAFTKFPNIEKLSVYTVYSYELLPMHPINIARFVGQVTPYLELLIGLGLVFGVFLRLAALGAEAAAESVGLVQAGKAPRIPQADEDATFAPAIRREELVIDWGQPAAAVANLIRAFSPRPGARTTRAGELLKVLSAQEGKNPGAGRGMPGVVMEVTSEGFWVAAREGCLLVARVQPAGGKVMVAADYVKGYRLRPGERLGA